MRVFLVIQTFQKPYVIIRPSSLYFYMFLAAGPAEPVFRDFAKTKTKVFKLKMTLKKIE